MMSFAIRTSPAPVYRLLTNYYLRQLMEKRKEIVMSGIRPTGFLHLGNYFGAVRNYVRMQEDFECYFMLADLHSLTTHPDTKELKANVHRVLAENIACGLDPDKVALYCQSHIYETAELYLPDYLLTRYCKQQILFCTVHCMCLLAKTRSNTWKWQEILLTGSTIDMEKFFPNRRHSIMAVNW